MRALGDTVLRGDSHFLTDIQTGESTWGHCTQGRLTFLPDIQTGESTGRHVDSKIMFFHNVCIAFSSVIYFIYNLAFWVSVGKEFKIRSPDEYLF